MKFAMFYEMPVASPWGKDDEDNADQHTIEQVVLGDKLGFHSFRTVEHQFLEEYSHGSNPEVLYGPIAALTQKLRHEDVMESIELMGKHVLPEFAD